MEVVEDVMQTIAEQGRGRYFAAADTSIKCYRCGRPGHIAAACLNPSIAPGCTLCAEPGHDARRCPTAVCMICGGKGHLQRKCPTVSKPEADRSQAREEAELGSARTYGPLGICTDVDQEDSRPRSRRAVMEHAAQRGTLALASYEWAQLEDQPTPLGSWKTWAKTSKRHPALAGPLKDLAHVTCAVCGQLGHAACGWLPEPRRTVSCSNCGHDGHHESQCKMDRPSFAQFAARISRDNGGCFKCGDVGHFAANCPQSQGKSNFRRFSHGSAPGSGGRGPRGRSRSPGHAGRQTVHVHVPDTMPGTQSYYGRSDHLSAQRDRIMGSDMGPEARKKALKKLRKKAKKASSHSRASSPAGVQHTVVAGHKRRR